VWIAVSMPAMLAFAISNDWSMVAWTAGVFLLLELLMVYAVEPWVYGRSAGLSPIAIITAALFWTWLWGPVGLLLATPLTVCVAVMGRYIPEMGFLNMLLGVEPVLAPEARFYQRLVALDPEEATDLAEKYVAEHGLESLFDAVLMPALTLIERDRHQGAFDERRERFILETTRRIVEEIEERAQEKNKEEEGGKKPEAPPPQRAMSQRPRATVCVVAAHDEADHVAGMILARMLPEDEFEANMVSFPILSAEALDEIEKNDCKLVCISAVPPHAATQAGYLAKRLRRRFPDCKIVVGLWTSDNNVERVSQRLVQAGVDAVATRLSDAVSELRQFAPIALEQPH
jgi:hypothetical protein